MSASRSIPVSTPSPVEQVDEILGRDVPGGTGSEGTAAEAANRRIENGRSGLHRRERVRVARVARVVEVPADRRRRAPPPARRACRTCAGTATPIVSAEEKRVGLGEAISAAISKTRLSSTGPSNGHPKATLTVTAERIASARARSTMRDRRVQRLSHRCVLVPLVERLRRAEGEADLVQSGGDEAVVSPLVQREPGVDDAVDSVERRNDLLRAGHLRHPSRIDEARHLHGSDARSHELADELAADLGSEDFGLVLEPVARADVDYEHADR